MNAQCLHIQHTAGNVFYLCQGRIQDYSPEGGGGGQLVFSPRGGGGSNFCPRNTIPWISTFKQMLAICICLTNITGSNHEEVSTNRDTLFLCVFFRDFLVLYHLFFSRGEVWAIPGGGDPLGRPAGPAHVCAALLF